MPIDAEPINVCGHNHSKACASGTVWSSRACALHTSAATKRKLHQVQGVANPLDRRQQDEEQCLEHNAAEQARRPP